MSTTTSTSGTNTNSKKINRKGVIADIVVCYDTNLPHHKTIATITATITATAAMKTLAAILTAAAIGITTATAQTNGGTLSALNIIGGASDFLPVSEAFRANITAPSPEKIRISFDVADNYYLYRDKIRLRSLHAAASVAPLQLPAANKIGDPYFGDVWIYDHDVTVTAALTATDVDAAAIPLELTYQGCAKDGVCYVPVVERWTLALSDGVAVMDDGVHVYSDVADTDADGATFAALLLGAFAAGLLLTFTPCVLPMVPVVAAVVAGAGGGRGRGGLLAAVYVLGTVAAYAAAGAVAGASGEQLQAFFQHEIFLVIAAVFFAAMALAMFGVFHLQVPVAVQSRINMMGSGGSVAGVFVLGALSALLIGACVSPVLVSVLGVALRTADPLLGAAMLASMAVGMGVILIAAGFGAGIAVARAGPWLATVKHAFGIALAAVAVYLLGAIPAVPVQLLWGALFIAVGIAALRGKFLPGGKGAQLACKTVGVFFLVWGITATVGGFGGNRNPLQPVDVFIATDTVTDTVTDTDSISVTDTVALDSLIATAAAEGKKLALYYHADWCVDCARLERTFNDADVAQTLRRDFLFAEVDLTDSFNPDARALRRRFNVFGPPALLLFTVDGALAQKVYGYRDADALLSLLRAI